MVPFAVKKLRNIPPELQKRHQENDLRWYGPSEILVGVQGKKVVGGIRVSRESGNRMHGVLADLFFEEQLKTTLARALIQSGEHLLAAKKVNVYAGLVVDGRGLVGAFYKSGYKPVRRTVILSWDLTRLPKIETTKEIRVQVDDHPTRAIARFIAQSYQPYWVWWRGKTLSETRARIQRQMRRFGWHGAQRFFSAYQGRKRIGVTDAKVRHRGDTFDWGPMIGKDVTGKRLGSSLLVPALSWLRANAIRRAQLTVTSGLDDYDPVVYVCTLSTGAIIEKEFVVLEKSLA